MLPDDYGMPEGEHEALGASADGARALAPVSRLDTFHKRLAALQDSAVRAAEQKNGFDDFFGWSNPDLLHEEGNVRPRKGSDKVAESGVLYRALRQRLMELEVRRMAEAGEL